ncbi:MAG TPA: hypothetical protein VHN37_03095 [Actinomycetota bacterium]|nr:hypothetical protein [Actinomycetota bacterium]
METASLRSEWEARPPTLRLYVIISLLGSVASIVFDPDERKLPSIMFSLVGLFLLKKLWDGSRAIWQLFVFVSFGVVVLAISVAFERPSALVGAAACGATAALLLHRSTRAWIDSRDPLTG